ncbi:MAG: DUF2147 domain-containing protein [Bradyrhizobium guangdongense]
MRLQRNIWLATVLLLLAPASARAANPTGLWLTADGEAKVRISACGDALCGRIEWLKEPDDPDTHRPKLDKFNKDAVQRTRPVLGLEIISGMKPSGRPDEWRGSLYDPESGNTYTGLLAMRGPASMKLEGCALAVFCRAETWKRTN